LIGVAPCLFTDAGGFDDAGNENHPRISMKLPTCLGAILFTCLAFVFPGATVAQSPVRIVSGFPAGGGVDNVARLLADHLSKQSGVPYMVDTKTGAGGIIAVQSMLRAPRDGSVLLIAPDSNIVIYPHTVSAPGFNALKDLVPVAELTSYDLAFSVKADPAVPDFSKFRQLAKNGGQAATFASPAAGSLQHFYGIAVAKAADISLLHVPYRGVAPALTDTIGGNVAAVVTPVGPVLQHATAGSIRILATSGDQRGRTTPQVPTFKELGYAQLVARGWFGLFAPAGTPIEKVRSINAMLRSALEDDGFKRRLSALDMDSRWMPPEQFAAQVAADDRVWAELVKQSGFKADN
jgi:tripartite-type tricarboxylate transporter receptor subunit TctC